MQKFLIAAAALAAVTASAAWAQGDAAPQHGPSAMFAAADTDHDGKVSRAEYDAAHAAHFAQMDANHDGALQADEQPHWGPPAGTSAPAAGAGEHHGMPSMDANGDGVVSRAEFDALGAAMFAHVDANGDGQITQDEIAAMHH